MNEDVEFLINLQKELKSQSDDSQAHPRFWTVGDYRWVECMEENSEKYFVYLPSAGESCDLNKFLDDEEEENGAVWSLEQRNDYDEIDCEESALEWIQKYDDEDASLVPTKREHFVRENTFFLTKSEAKRHIEVNHYHYTKDAHTYAMTAWRAPTVERLFKILYEFDFTQLKGK